MITLELCGGLGNQMFQYALFLKFKSSGKRIKLDLKDCLGAEGIRKYGLDIFGITIDSLPYCLGESFIYKAVNKLCGHRLTYDEIEKGMAGEYQPEILDINYGRLRGYWQNEMYFKDVAEYIKNVYKFDVMIIDKRNVILAQEMQNENSVSVHIRRGDYLDESNVHVYGQICDKKYYDRAIMYMKSTIDNPKFYLFSDDPMWTRSNILEEGMQLVDWNTEKNSWQDMYLMSKCRHHIIANSSFSWWGAWLGEDDNKIVVAPSRWFSNHECTDTICRDWIRC